MSRILLTWELGLNAGHLARLLPVAKRLNANGHAVLVAVRDIPTASTILGPALISFVQAPILVNARALRHELAGYADILLSQGWAEPSVLWGLVQAWINLYRMFTPDVIVADFSPTACLAARICNIPVVLIGNGFELPPADEPLPAFPKCPWVNQSQIMASEYIALDAANAVAKAFNGRTLKALRDIFEAESSLLATFSELDHYQPRTDALYIGLLYGQMQTDHVEWPPGNQHRIFAYLRPNTENLEALLEGLSQSQASVVCYVPGLSKTLVNQYQSTRMLLPANAVNLEALASIADICVTYGAEGTITTFMLNGVPQLISPKLLESYIKAHCIVELGAGLALPAGASSQMVVAMLNQLLQQPSFKQAAMAFAEKYRTYDAEQSVNAVVEIVEHISNRKKASGDRSHQHK